MDTLHFMKMNLKQYSLLSETDFDSEYRVNSKKFHRVRPWWLNVDETELEDVGDEQDDLDTD